MDIPPENDTMETAPFTYNNKRQQSTTSPNLTTNTKRPQTGFDGTTHPALHFNEHFTDPDVDNLRIDKLQALIYPQLLLEEIPATKKGKRTVLEGRIAAANVLEGVDDRLIVIVGPCSIHDAEAAREYARRLQTQIERHKEYLVILMRVYFEKPRTVAGWKGLINDPYLDESFEINTGLRIGRKLLADINDLGIPVGCEYLDTMVPQYTADLVSWAAIGARTTECQLHRQLASGLSMPVGFKNGTSGDVQIAIDACRSASIKHCFLGITKQGLPAICHSKGNPHTHVILRGGSGGPNFDEKSVGDVGDRLKKVSACTRIIVDCSHGNSMKDHKKQCVALDSICQQVKGGNTGKNIAGVMLESHLFEGGQSLPHESTLADLRDRRRSSTGGEEDFEDHLVLRHLKWGVSITDKCVGWEETVVMLEKLANAVSVRREESLSTAPTRAMTVFPSPNS